MIGGAEFYQTEVEHLDGVTSATVWFQPDIIRLQISVNDPRAMSLFNCRTNLFQNIDDPRNRQRTFFRNDLGERAAVEIFHHQVRDWSIRGLRESEVSYVNDVRMPQPSGSFRLTSETSDKLIVG